MSTGTSGDPLVPEPPPAETAGPPPPETAEEARTRLQREVTAGEVAERARLAREQQDRAAARRAALEGVRRLEDEESARARGQRAERWHREQAELSRVTAEKAAAKARAKADARRDREVAAAAKQARRATRRAARQAAAERPAPERTGPERTGRERTRRERTGRERTGREPADGARATPSAAEIAALASLAPPSPGADAPPPRPADAGGPRSYTERYAALEATGPDEGRVALRPRSAARRLVTLLLVVLLLGSGVLGLAAWQEPTLAGVGLAAACGGLTLVVWAARASSAPVRVVLDHGRLEVTQRGARHTFDLTTTFTQVELSGRPGRRGWRATLSRGDAPPLVLDARAVDPRQLTEVVRRWRPEL